ncbi:LOW QUALITY PROTEIN: uracil-DNA glycosylase, mitochondrial [Glycine max]|uniref:LOW QUALITY PROTEIN: uracil-DNA glycosylase, mitochondrial n=1 Tax=Glycine max TaxID=3847 RepID=UPI001B355C7C|nr:LOW QUALITY PROTEIN: uracil-DNA glycosylase, mitochondrial [Glycine max]
MGWKTFSNPLSDEANSSTLSLEQKSRVEYNKLLAKSKRNLKLCIERVSKSKESDSAGVKLEELLVEETWLDALPDELQKPYALTLSKFVGSEISCGGDDVVFPPTHLIFNALNSTPFHTVKAVILGQVFGCLRVQRDGNFDCIWVHFIAILRDLSFYKDCSKGNVDHQVIITFGTSSFHTQFDVSFCLYFTTCWLIYQEASAYSHVKKGWEQFTDAVIKTISQKEGVVFLLWGNSAPEKSRLIDATKHHVLTAAHPSGLSANRGFFGCRHFSCTILEQMGIDPIDSQL